MKKLSGILTLFFVLILTLGCIGASAKQIEIENTQVKLADIPDEYIKLYTKSYHDAEFNSMIDAKQIETDVEIMAFDKTFKNHVLLYVKSNDNSDDSSAGSDLALDSAERSDLVNDYNMVSDKIDFVNSKMSSLVSQGYNVQTNEWFEFQGGVTPYIMSVYNNSQNYVTDFTTIYNDTEVILRFVDTSAPDSEKLEKYKNVAKSITYTRTVKYEKTKEVVKQQEAAKASAEKAQQEKVEESSDYIFWTVTAVVIIVLIFSVYMATRKKRKSVVKND
ncbi:MAG: hypothetical protein IJB70_12150 [Clostridia bacterium]|nr:hypothetical protein [Clostridia bacterium]